MKNILNKNKIIKQLKNHAIDSTAMLVASTPIFAGLENVVLGMSDEVSTNARLLATTLTYGGFGFLISKSRDFYRKTLKITDQTKERKQQIHDSIYGGLFNLIIAPGFYYTSGVRDLNEILGGTAISILFGLTSGGLMGYSIDMFRDLTGIKESARVPRYIKNKSSNFKLGLATAITAASIALTAGIYKITSDKKQFHVNPQNVNMVYNKDYNNLDCKLEN
ncbi:MAG: hypothetical protein AABW56_01980 [Nanoarchaeota archaeon]